MLDAATDAVLGPFDLMLSEAFTHVLCRVRVGAGTSQHSQIAKARSDGGGQATIHHAGWCKPDILGMRLGIFTAISL